MIRTKTGHSCHGQMNQIGEYFKLFVCDTFYRIECNLSLVKCV